MKLTAFILLLSLMQVSASTFGQKLTLKENNITYSKVFFEIRKQTGYSVVLVENSDFNISKRINVNFDNTNLESVLEDIVAGTKLTYVIEDKTIVLREKEKLFLDNLIARFQAIDVHGRVIDENGQPLAGTSVSVKGKNISTTTDINGGFLLKGVEQGEVIVISYIGFERLEIGAAENMGEIRLKASLSKLDEVQVIAYGTTTQRLNTGNVSTVKAADIEKQPVTNPLAALQGRVPGVTITQNTGVPGGSFSVRIRGKNSIAFDSQPLYIVDGVPYTSSLLNNFGNGITSKIGENGGNPLNHLNISDIESIDVLKDADATAIYGSRGANGVVLITTKKGKTGKMTFDARLYGGTGEVGRKLELLSSEQYIEMRREALKNDNISTPAAFERDLSGDWGNGTQYRDWQKIIIGNSAQYRDAYLSVSGGNVLTTYLVSGTYHKESTVFPGDFNAGKAAFHVNLGTTSLNQKFKMNVLASYVNDNSILPRADPTINIFASPVSPEGLKEDGSLNWQYNSAGVFTFTPPQASLLNKFRNTTNNLIGNLQMSYKLLPGLDLSTSLGYNNLMIEELVTSPLAAFAPTFPSFAKIARAGAVNNSIRSWIIEPLATYHNNIGKGNLTVLLGATLQKNYNKGQQIEGLGFTSDLTLENISSAPTTSVSPATISQYKYNALFGRVNYEWNKRYIANLTIRRDGSSRFGPDQQFHNFYAIGGAWLFSNENVIKNNLSFLSFGKIRASFGTTGSDQIGDYKFLDLYSISQSPYQGGTGFYPSNLFNADLQWELTKKLEVGLELGFLKDRVLLSASAYRNRSSNQLLNMPLPATTGFSFIPTNLPALIENRGLEFSLNTQNIETEKFSWKTGFNLTFARNELKEFPNLVGSSFENTLVIGQPLTILKLYHYNGLDPLTGTYTFGDGNGGTTKQPEANPNLTRYSIVNAAPQYYGGFQNTFRLGNFQLDANIQFVKQKGQRFLFNPVALPGRFNNLGNQPITVLDRWQQPNDQAKVQKFSTSFFNEVTAAQDNILNSDMMYGDASFIRLKNVALSYTIPTNLKNKLHLQNARIFFQGQNLFTITNYQGFDPENQSVTNLPMLRVMTFGIHLTY